MDSITASSVVSMLNFLSVGTVLWSCRRTSLFTAKCHGICRWLSSGLGGGVPVTQRQTDRHRVRQGADVMVLTHWRSQRKKTRCSYDSAIPRPGIYPEKNPKTLIWKDTCTPMFIAALFTTAKVWNQLKCPSTNEWIRKMWCIKIYTMNYYSAIKRNKILPPATTWMDL